MYYAAAEPDSWKYVLYRNELDKFSEKFATSIFSTEEAQDGGNGLLRKIATLGITSWKTLILISDL